MGLKLKITHLKQNNIEKTLTNIIIFIEFTKRLILYIPIIWKDRDYDYEFLYDLIKFKIQRMKKAYETDGKFVVNHERYVKEMNIVLNYLDRYLKADDKFLSTEETYSKYKWFEHEKHKEFNKKMFFTKLEKWLEHWWF